MTIEEKAEEHSKNNLCKECICVCHEPICPNPSICKERKNDIKTFLAGAKEAARWIPVEESLPEKQGLCLAKGFSFTVLWYRGGKFYSVLEGGYEISIGGITHWRSIEFE